MTNPTCYDPATEIIHSVLAAMRAVFSPKSECSPLGGGSDKVWFFAGEGAPIGEFECNQPFPWVRFASRHRSEIFPDVALTMSPCGSQQVVTVEIGVARCAIMDEGTLNSYADEARVSMDDCWRLSKVPCIVAGDFNNTRQVAADAVVPYGPEGGLIVWTSNLYVSV